MIIFICTLMMPYSNVPVPSASQAAILSGQESLAVSAANSLLRAVDANRRPTTGVHHWGTPMMLV